MPFSGSFRPRDLAQDLGVTVKAAPPDWKPLTGSTTLRANDAADLGRQLEDFARSHPNGFSINGPFYDAEGVPRIVDLLPI